MSQKEKLTIELRKKITQPFLVRIITTLSEEKLISPTSVCYEMLIDGLRKEFEKRKSENGKN